MWGTGSGRKGRKGRHKKSNVGFAATQPAAAQPTCEVTLRLRNEGSGNNLHHCVHAGCATAPDDNERVWLKGVTKGVAMALGRNLPWFETYKGSRVRVCLTHLVDEAKHNLRDGQRITLRPEHILPLSVDPVVAGAVGRRSPAAAIAPPRDVQDMTPPHHSSIVEELQLADLIQRLKDKDLAVELSDYCRGLLDEAAGLRDKLTEARQESVLAKRKLAAAVKHGKRKREPQEDAPVVECDCGCRGATLYTWEGITLTDVHTREYTALTPSQLCLFWSFWRCPRRPRSMRRCLLHLLVTSEPGPEPVCACPSARSCRQLRPVARCPSSPGCPAGPPWCSRTCWRWCFVVFGYK